MSLPGVDQIYAARLDSELHDLARTEAYLDAPHLDGSLPAGIRRDIRVLIQDVRSALDLQRSVVDWPGLRSARNRAKAVRTELFCLVQTSLFRAEGYDGAILDAAERLAAHLQAGSRIRRPVLLAVAPDSESMDHTLSVLRLRFPATSVWGLPVLAHEFGHHAVEHLDSASEQSRGTRPLLDVVRREAAAGGAGGTRWAHEYAADVVATYAMGAAYPLTCLALRVDPDEPSTPSETHPPWDRRIEIMAATLEAISARIGTGGHAAMAERLVRPLWGTISGGPAPEPAHASMLGLYAETLVAELQRHTSGLLYDDADRALGLADHLEQRTTTAPDLTGAGVPTVIDAAWRWRRGHWGASAAELKRVQGIALEWCRQVEGDEGRS